MFLFWEQSNLEDWLAILLVFDATIQMSACSHRSGAVVRKKKWLIGLTLIFSIPTRYAVLVRLCRCATCDAANDVS